MHPPLWKSTPWLPCLPARALSSQSTPGAADCRPPPPGGLPLELGGSVKVERNAWGGRLLLERRQVAGSPADDTRLVVDDLEEIGIVAWAYPRALEAKLPVALTPQPVRLPTLSPPPPLPPAALSLHACIHMPNGGYSYIHTYTRIRPRVRSPHSCPLLLSHSCTLCAQLSMSASLLAEREAALTAQGAWGGLVQQLVAAGDARPMTEVELDPRTVSDLAFRV